MRETTSERQVEGPAAVFSERGLAMFLEFVAAVATGKTPDLTGGLFGQDVNAFVAAWERHNAAGGPQEAPEVETPGEAPENAADGRAGGRRRDWAAEYKELKAIMYGKGLMQLKHIAAGMQDAGYWQTSNPTQQIRRFMEHYPDEIVDTRRGTYHWPTGDEIVLKLREDCPECANQRPRGCKACNGTGFKQDNNRGGTQHEQQQPAE